MIFSFLILIQTPCDEILRQMDMVESIDEARTELNKYSHQVTEPELDEAIMRLFKRMFILPISLPATHMEKELLVSWMRDFAKKQVKK